MAVKVYQKYPIFTPELKETPERYLKPHFHGLLSIIVTKFFMQPYIEKNGVVFTKFKRPPLGTHAALWATQGYALSNYNAFIDTNREEYKKRFLFISNWLEKKFDRTFNGWLNTHKKQAFISSLSQGRGLSVMIRAHSLKNKIKYLDICEKIITTFLQSNEKGGLLSIDNCNCYWYEEDPSIPHILNGFITSLIGLYEYYDYTNDKKAKKLFDSGISTLKKHMSDFELNKSLFKWTRYTDEKGSFAKDSYHQIHVDQMAVLYNLTRDSFFSNYHKKWQAYSIKYKNIVRLVNAFYYLKKFWKVFFLKEPVFRQVSTRNNNY